MRVLVTGKGGREHALVWALARSQGVEKVYCAPGNAGIAAMAECVALNLQDAVGVAAWCRRENVGIVVIGPDSDAVAGLAEALRGLGIDAVGPSSAAGALEGSKGFMKDFCGAEGIPTAGYARFKDEAAALAYVREQGAPIVVKADGLAAGKGVVVATTLDEALAAVRMCFDGGQGEVVVEEFLQGEEVSFFILSDGEHALPLTSAQDHKRAFDGDRGPNTGGMGAYSPAPVFTPEIEARVMREIVEPTLRGMKARGTPFAGVLYAGLMLTKDGPKLIEYNVRFGDPECQVLVPRLASDFAELMLAAAQGRLNEVQVRWRDEVALTVVMATKGYPAAYEEGSAIGLEAVPEDVLVFHAGTALRDGVLVAAGGRVLNITALGTTVKEAQAKAYAAVDAVRWDDGFCRRDIGWRAVA